MTKNKIKGIIAISFFIFIIMFNNVADLYAVTDPLPKAEDLIEKFIEITGDRKDREKIYNNKIEINTYSPLISTFTNIITYKERPNKFYSIQVNDMGMKREVGTDGDVVWEITSQNGPSIKEGEERANLLITNAFDLLVSWKTFFKSAQTIGMEEVNGKPCYKVVMTSFEKSKRVYFFERDSFLLAKVISETKTPLGYQAVETFPSDYKEADGILVPYKYESFIKGYKVAVTDIKSIKNNVDIPKDRFDLPYEIRWVIKQRNSRKIEQKTVYFESNTLLRCIIQLPENYDAIKTYPLVIWLHGGGDKPEEFVFYLSYLAQEGIIVAGPQAPYAYLTEVGVGYFWSLTTRGYPGEGDGKSPKLSFNYIIKLVEELKNRYNVGKIYLMGFSEGGMFAYRVGLLKPHLFSGLIIFGSFLHPLNFPNGIPTSDGSLKIFIAQGDNDVKVIKSAEKSRDYLIKNGYDVNFTWYQAEHEITPEAMDKAIEWLKPQIATTQ